jgi:hypothetical protein
MLKFLVKEQDKFSSVRTIWYIWISVRHNKYTGSSLGYETKNESADKIKDGFRFSKTLLRLKPEFNLLTVKPNCNCMYQEEYAIL